MCSKIYEIWHLVQIEHASSEHGMELMILTQSYRFGQIMSTTEICSNFYEILHSQQIEHADYEYNTRHGLERSNDYWLGMIIGCKIRLIFWTRLIALTPR